MVWQAQEIRRWPAEKQSRWNAKKILHIGQFSGKLRKQILETNFDSAWKWFQMDIPAMTAGVEVTCDVFENGNKAFT